MKMKVVSRKPILGSGDGYDEYGIGMYQQQGGHTDEKGSNARSMDSESR